MFQDSLLESGGRIRIRRGLTATFSFALESLLLATVVLFPLLHDEALPARVWFIDRIPLPPLPPHHAQPSIRTTRTGSRSELFNSHLLEPPRIPTMTPTIVEQQAPPTRSVVGIPNGIGNGAPDGVMNSILMPGSSVVPYAKPAPPRSVRVSQGVVQGLLIHQVTPEYPVVAKLTRTEGTVLLRAVIGRDGSITGLQLVSGPPLLVQAAITAVREWRYRPYTLNGDPVEVDTFIEVHFKLSGN